jgi:SAM-dependent methyltransferase
LNKICDAADWSIPELRRIIRDELAEVPRFHRKQWEFAVIYRELDQRGLLNGSSEGISFGSATEVMLYALARRVKHLWATDLYGTDAVWDIARTDDATQLVKRSAPFAYPEDRLSARAMDMRDVSFPDETFDFAYSSCAIEHIGKRDDFNRHLREVGRVLKPGGVYAFTTEFTYAEQTVEMPGNYYFSRHALAEMVRESGLYCDAQFDTTLAHHRANTPLPVELTSGVADGDGHFTEKLFGLMSAVQLNSATTAFTSCLVVLEKTDGGEFSGWRYKGWDQTRDFIQGGLGLMRGIVEDAEMRLPPFAWMPQRRSPYFLGHEHFFNREASSSDPSAFFHTGYFWLGGKPRPIRVTLMMRAEGAYRIRLKVHRARGAAPWIAELASYFDFDDTAECVFKEWMLEPDDDWVYAFLGEVLDGKVKLVDVSVTCAPCGTPLLPVAR